MDNITRIAFKGKTRIECKPLYQYDYGQKLKFVDLVLPYNYEVHFSNYDNGTSITQVGGPDGVLIPDSLLTTGLNIYAWIFLHTGANDGETEYMVTVPVYKRAEISNEEPSPVEQDSITQTIAALNTASNSISTNLAESALYVRDAQAARDGAQAYMQITESYKNQVAAVVGSNYIMVGSTKLTESDLQKLLALIEE